MALRVLLADESPTIKRVIQLSLADYGVEVKSVGNGLDVQSVTESFQPDIVFIDILLSKKDGYTVCQELKKNPATQTTPVVLMWSGFMEVDDAKVRACLSDARLEKPFDSDQLRTLVQDLVPSTSSNPVSAFLQFPDMPDFEEAPMMATPSIPQEVPSMEFGSNDQAFNTNDSLEFGTKGAVDFGTEGVMEFGDEGPEEFQPVPLTPTRGPTPFVEIESPNPDGFFASPLPTEEFEEVSFVKPSPKKQLSESLIDREVSQTQAGGPASLQLSASMIEKVVREEVQKQIEDICWKIIPDIAERVIREEIHKMIQETERSL